MSEQRLGQFTGLRNGTGKTIEGEVFHDARGELILYIAGAGTFHVSDLPRAISAVEQERKAAFADAAPSEDRP